MTSPDFAIEAPPKYLTDSQYARAEALDRASEVLFPAPDGDISPARDLVCLADWIINGDDMRQVRELLDAWRADLDSEPPHTTTTVDQLCEAIRQGSA